MKLSAYCDGIVESPRYLDDYYRVRYVYDVRHEFPEGLTRGTGIRRVGSMEKYGIPRNACKKSMKS